MDWTAFFEKRPDLNPPGYEQVLEQIKAQPYVKPRKKQKKR